MADDDTPAGFLGRWSRRKAEVRQGKAVSDPVPGRAPVVDAMSGKPNTHGPNAGSLSPPPTTQDLAGAPRAQSPQSVSQDDTHPAAPAPTLDDVQSLTPESDYTPFMARGVTSDVKNAAMKKLFTDPHFQVMDRMDVYIDDYGQPDPIPLAMLRQMNGAKFLNLFNDDTETPAGKALGDLPTDAPSQLVAQSPPASPLSPNDTIPHDHADLRLQPDPTPRCEGTGPEPA